MKFDNEQFEYLIRRVTSQLHHNAMLSGGTVMVERMVDLDNSLIPAITIAMNFNEASPEIEYTEVPILQKKLFLEQPVCIMMHLRYDGRIVYHHLINASSDDSHARLMRSTEPDDYVTMIMGDLHPEAKPVTQGFRITGNATIH